MRLAYRHRRISGSGERRRPEIRRQTDNHGIEPKATTFESNYFTL